MGKLRLTFVKEGRAVYLSHLDLLRTFQRVFLRQGLVLRHSQGYHPHPIISFALPLPVGQASDCEVLDFEVTEDLTGAGLAEDLNRFMPDGIRALDCRPPVRPVRDLAELRCRVELLYDGGVPAGFRTNRSRRDQKNTRLLSPETGLHCLFDKKLQSFSNIFGSQGKSLLTVIGS